MKAITQCIIAVLTIIYFPCHGQGWVAEIDLDLNHENYAREQIDQVSITFSGQTVTGQSQTSTISFVIRGENPMSGELDITINGTAFDPYDQNIPATRSLLAAYSGNYSTSCTKGFLHANGQTPAEHLSIWVTVYPRLEVSSFTQECTNLILTSNTCSPEFHWEVSDSFSGPFIPIPYFDGATLSITRDELAALGLVNVYGRKYFRVTGIEHTTSQLQPVDIYYPGPALNLQSTRPRCHKSTDGSMQIEVTSPSPSSINDFVITLFTANGDPLLQQYISDVDTLTLKDLSAGTYMLNVANNTAIDFYGSCWTEKSFTLIDPDPVTIASVQLSDYNGYGVTCSDANDGSIAVTASGGTGRISEYLWDAGVSSSGIAQELTAGTYHVKAVDSNGCLSKDYAYEITAPEKLSLNLISTGAYNGFDVSCHDQSDGSLTSEIFGGVQPYSYEWSDGVRVPNRTGLDPGHYQLVASDVNNCKSIQEIHLMAPPPIAFDINEIQSVQCAGDSSGWLEVSAIKNTIGNFSVWWSSGESGVEIVNKPAGVYSVTVADEQGCRTSANYELSDPSELTLTAVADLSYNGSAISCWGAKDGRITVHVSGLQQDPVEVDRFTWFKDDKQFLSGPGDTIASNLASGVYRIQMIYRSICKTETILVLAEPDPLKVAISGVSDYNGVPVSCAGARDGYCSAIATGGTGLYTFHWNTGAVTKDITGIGAGTYSVTTTDANGCEAVGDIIIADPTPLRARIEIVSTITCADSANARISGVADGGIMPYTYRWDSGEEAKELSNISAGKYGITVFDANGCRGDAETLVTEPFPVDATIVERSYFNGYALSCHGASDGSIEAIASGGTPGYTFQWLDSNDGPRRDRLRAGTYIVRIMDSKGCLDSVSHVIVPPDKMTLQVASYDNSSCFNGNDGFIILAPDGGVGNYEYALDYNWQASNTFSSLRSGSYQLYAKDANGCIASVIQSIDQPSPISLNFQDIAPALCGDPVGSVSATVTGGTGAYTLRWTNSSGVLVGSSATIKDLRAGIYTLSITDGNECSAVRSVGITSSDGPAVKILSTTETTCSYTSDGSANLEVSGNEPFTFLWPDGNTTSMSGNLKKGIHLIEVRDANDCITIESVTINAPDSLVIEVADTAMPTCYGYCDGKIVVQAKGGNDDYTYTWNGSPGSLLDSICAGSYTVTVRDRKDCIADRTIQVRQPEPVVVSTLDISGISCPGQCDGKVSIAGSGGTGTLNYEWSNGKLTPSVSGLCAGVLTLVASDSNQCKSITTYVLEDPTGTALDLGDPVTLCTGQSHLLQISSEWEEPHWGSSLGLEASGRQLEISEAGTYWLEATDKGGCIARDTFQLRTSNDLLKANFLVTSQAFAMDTIVVIDVTWPLPESAIWTLPEEMRLLSNTGDVIYGQFETPGNYPMTLHTTLGACKDTSTKTIEILDADEKFPNAGRQAHTSFLKEFTVFPNPNSGSFDLIISFQESSPVIITISEISTSRVVATFRDDVDREYQKRINLGMVTSGVYTVRLDYSAGTTFKRMIIR